MPNNGVRTDPEYHKLYYVEDATGMFFMTHVMEDEYRLIETWVHEDSVVLTKEYVYKSSKERDSEA